MKDPYQVLRQKETDIERVRKEIEALRFVIPLLAEDGDRIEHGPASPTLRRAGSRNWDKGLERVAPDRKIADV